MDQAERGREGGRNIRPPLSPPPPPVVISDRGAASGGAGRARTPNGRRRRHSPFNERERAPNCLQAAAAVAAAESSFRLEVAPVRPAHAPTGRPAGKQAGGLTGSRPGRQPRLRGRGLRAVRRPMSWEAAVHWRRRHSWAQREILSLSRLLAEEKAPHSAGRPTLVMHTLPHRGAILFPSRQIWPSLPAYLWKQHLAGVDLG